ncbi:MAG: hypothetical protein PHN39_04255 [Candidatus Pacebacteria bacterium]|nr:hypothetical protein [Candidatus Paceibacterota bacterium]
MTGKLPIEIKGKKEKFDMKCAGEVTVKLTDGVRFEPLIKVLEWEEGKDGEMIVKKSELIELSIVFDNK